MEKKGGKTCKCSLSAEKQVLCNIWFCGTQSLNNNPDLKIDICFWEEVQKLHSSVFRLLVTLVLAMTFKGFEGLFKLCQDPKKEKKKKKLVHNLQTTPLPYIPRFPLALQNVIMRKLLSLNFSGIS